MPSDCRRIAIGLPPHWLPCGGGCCAVAILRCGRRGGLVLLLLFSRIGCRAEGGCCAVACRWRGQGWRVLFSIPCCRNRMPCEGVVIRLPPPMKSAWEVCPVPDPLPQAVVVWKRYCRCHPMESRQRDVPDSAGRVECGVWRACPIVGLGGGVFYTMVGCLAWKSACTTCRSAGVRAGRLCGWQRGIARGSVWRLRFAAVRSCGTPPLVFRSAVSPYLLACFCLLVCPLAADMKKAGNDRFVSRFGAACCGADSTPLGIRLPR